MVLKKTIYWERDRGWRRANPWVGKRGSLNQEDLEKGCREQEEEDWGANCPMLSIVII